MGEAKTKLDEALSRIRVLELHRNQLMRSVTLRDQFAMAALIGIINSAETRTPDQNENARYAYDHADAMMRERERSSDHDD